MNTQATDSSRPFYASDREQGAVEKMPFEPVIGLEVHVQLKTKTKIFCRCANLYGAKPNTLICPTCLGYPGTLPKLNRKAVDLASKISLALGATVHATSIFARKNYFYADLPKGYQISQFDRPLATGGKLPLLRHAGTVEIHRLHLEEDAGKLLHESPGGTPLRGTSLVDFNRAGVPLVEIVTEPVIRSSAEAQDFLQSLRQLLLYTEVSDANMEEGSMRCDANISVRRRGETRLGAKTEIKNLNSFRHVARALDYEIERQIGVLGQGGQIFQETRTYNANDGTTSPMRGKEGSHDYRYFPEPDLPALQVGPSRLQAVRDQIPELPWVKRKRLAKNYDLAEEDAHLLSTSVGLADYFERVTESDGIRPQVAANWIKTEILRELKERKIGIEEAIASSRLVDVIRLVEGNQLSSSGGKTVLAASWDDPRPALELAQALGLVQISDPTQLEAWAKEILEAHPHQVTQYLAGKENVLGFFVGQMMKRSAGRADPKQSRELLRQQLASISSESRPS